MWAHQVSERAGSLRERAELSEFHQSQFRTSRPDFFRLQEPRESQLEGHRGCAPVLHLVAGLPRGWLQSDNQLWLWFAVYAGARLVASTSKYAPRLVSGSGLRSRHLTNNELGWKTTWLDRRVQWDGAIYQENWDHAQISLNAPGIVDLGLFINGGNYRVRGVETSLVARAGGRIQHRGRRRLESQRVGQTSTLLLDRWDTHRFQHTADSQQYAGAGSARGAR